MSQPVDIRDIVAGLAARIEALCAELLPAGRREGAEFRVGSLAGEPGRSMAVHVSGARAGVWCDFATGERGDALDLVAQARFHGDKAEAIRWARAWLGLDPSADSGPARSGRAALASAKPSAKPGPEDTLSRERAFRLWLEGRELEPDGGDPASLYLRGRGLELRALGRPVRALKWHPALWNRESGRKWPALLAKISAADGGFAAVHRIWLEARASGRVTKAPLEDPKMTLGRYRGGAVRLHLPYSRCDRVLVAEGIEDGLTVALACREAAVLVAVSLANMASMRLPREAAAAVVCADNDTAPEARAALARAVRNFRAQVGSVRVARSPVGKDFNDLLRDAG